MKQRVCYVLLAVSASFLIVTSTLLATVEWRSPAYLSLESGGAIVEFGLRDDGIVVWRKIHRATTNSPAEALRVSNWSTNVIIGYTNHGWRLDNGYIPNSTPPLP